MSETTAKYVTERDKEKAQTIAGNKHLFHAGLYCLKEAVYNVLLEASKTESRQLSNKEISDVLGISLPYQDSAGYPLLRGVLDELCREGRVARVDTGRKMIWRVKDFSPIDNTTAA